MCRVIVAKTCTFHSYIPAERTTTDISDDPWSVFASLREGCPPIAVRSDHFAAGEIVVRCRRSVQILSLIHI